MEYEKMPWKVDVPGEALQTLELQHDWKQTLEQRKEADGTIRPIAPIEDVTLFGTLLNIIGDLEKRIIALEASPSEKGQEK